MADRRRVRARYRLTQIKWRPHPVHSWRWRILQLSGYPVCLVIGALLSLMLRQMPAPSACVASRPQHTAEADLQRAQLALEQARAERAVILNTASRATAQAERLKQDLQALRAAGGRK
ncbi:hypothetical protein LMG29542_07663 [Paraburkholderia humisilvae]|uniref:Uncharacterized protein n=1 Tax=Paraburkholderia humisilvae TaxID=627669 RepID=A0A6J5F6Z3_9BURK|nr:hypothetical protein LMG29542_07663 [Paraburkholderia humisilvae]